MSSTSSSRAISTAKFLLGQDGAGVYRQVWDAAKHQVVTVHRDEVDGQDPCCSLYSCGLPRRSNSNVADGESVGSPSQRSKKSYASSDTAPDDGIDNESEDSEQDDGPHASADTALKMLRCLRTSPDLHVNAPSSPRRNITSDDDTFRAGPAAKSYSSEPGSPRGLRSPRALEPLRHSSPFAAAVNSSPIGSPQAASRLGSQSGSQHRAVSFAVDQPGSSTPRRMQVARSKSTGGSISGSRLPSMGVYDSSMPGGRTGALSRGQQYVSAELPSDLAGRRSPEPGGLDPGYQQGHSSSSGNRNGISPSPHSEHGHGVAFLEIQAERSDNSVRSRASSVSWAMESSDGSSSLWSGSLLNSAGALATRLNSADKITGEWPSGRRSGAGSLHQAGPEIRDLHTQQTTPGKGQFQRSTSPKPPALRLPSLRPHGKDSKGDGKGTAARGSGSPGNVAAPTAATAARPEGVARSANAGARSAGRGQSTAAEEIEFKPRYIDVQSLEQKVLSRAKSEKDSTRYDKIIPDL